jgi:[acyl-carrier-protein] S-malonyltransferase
MNDWALICSGQGAQSPALFSQFPFTAAGLAVRQRVLDSGTLPAPVAAWLAAPSAHPEQIYQDAFAQPLLCLYQAMVWAELAPLLPAPHLAAGYSLGELSAYGCAGVLAAEDVVALAAERARLMDAAAPPGRMIAVTGASPATAAALAAPLGGHLAIAISETHCVLGCLADRAEALAAALKSTARDAVILPVSVASHTPLLDAAVAPFREALRTRPCARFHFSVLAGIDATAVATAAAMLRTLPEQIHHTLRWDLVRSRLTEGGCPVLLELGPGSQLAHIALAEDGLRDVRSVSEFRTPSGIAAWLKRALNDSQ